MNRRCAIHPVVLAIDDIQWADEPSLRALLYVVRRSARERVAVLATLRPEDGTDGWVAAGGELLAEMGVRRVDLGPLDDVASAACLRGTAPSALSAELVHEAIELARGNPFYLGELGRTWVSETEREIPRNVLDLTRQRVGRLSAAAQELLRVAAVIGEQAEFAVMAQCLAKPAMACLELLQEAIDARLLRYEGAGLIQFTHALVRAALVETLSLHERVLLHERAASAIQDLYADSLQVHLADLARHAAAVAVVGDREPAVRWASAAAEAAARELAFEEASRLYGLALEVGGPSLPSRTRAALTVAHGEADAMAGRVSAAHRHSRAAADLARGLCDAPLMARVALTLDAVGARAYDRDIHEWCLEALELIGGEDLATRSRLMARLAEAQMYEGFWDEAIATSAEGLALARRAGDETLVAALRARQLAVCGPEHAAERAGLAAEMLALGRRLGRPDVEMWGRLWTIDTLWEVADLPAIEAEIAHTAWCANKLRTPLARWHVLVASSVLAQARAEYDEATRLATEAFEIMRALDHPAGVGAYMAIMTAIGRHRGHGPAFLEMVASVRTSPAEVRDEIFSYLGPAVVMADAGRLPEAADLYSRPGPVPSWRIPPFFQLQAIAAAADVAVALGRREDIAYTRAALLPHRHQHLVGGAGVGNYFGPVTLTLGRCDSALDDLAAAETNLRDAVATCARLGVPGHLVETQYELATVLRRTRRPAEATTLLRTAQASAERLGMAPILAKIEDSLGDVVGILSAREREVAELVAQGCSNRDIARRLVLSERTAANHVQHVLTKLGLSRRGEIAGWLARQ